MNDESTSRPEDTEQTAPPDKPARASVAAGRVWSLRTVVAAAITAVALSGAAGAALAAASDGGSSGGPGGRGGFGPPGQMPGGPPPQMNGVPGRLPPVTGNDDGRDT